MTSETINANRALGQIAATFRAYTLYALLPKIIAMVEKEQAAAAAPLPDPPAEQHPSR